MTYIFVAVVMWIAGFILGYGIKLHFPIGYVREMTMRLEPNQSFHASLSRGDEFISVCVHRDVDIDDGDDDDQPDDDPADFWKSGRTQELN